MPVPFHLRSTFWSSGNLFWADAAYRSLIAAIT
jgi:hypothetical protein